MITPKVRAVGDRIVDHLLQIEQMFLPGAKVTLLVRHPTVEDADMLLSTDDLVEAEAAIRKLREKDPLHGL